MKTTAQLRNEARDAEDAMKWAEAGRLYREAVAAYPPYHPGSQLAVRDVAGLEAKAKRCELAAAAADLNP